MTRYELKTLVSHHEDWLRGERNGIEAGLRRDDLRADFAEITRNLDVRIFYHKRIDRGISVSDGR